MYPDKSVKMQSVQEVIQGGRVIVDKSVESVSASDDVKNVVVSSSSRDRECRVPRVMNSRDAGSALLSGDSHSPLVIGDKYRLMDLVDGSSFYKCVNIATEEEYACKIVSRDSFQLVAAHYRLESHPRIASLHEIMVGNQYLYLIFPKFQGDLHSYVRNRKRLRESEAKRLFKQIAETVQVCHQNGIVLRDLKLRKFVFADSQRTELKLESLEDAVVLEQPQSDWLHDKRGCPAYVSPEILKAGATYSGKAADMWSLGVILYTMLAGRYPFSDMEHSLLFAKISRGHFTIPECLSSRARCLIRSLLRRDPSERITSEDILYHPWLAKEEREWTPRSCDQLVPECSMFDD